MLRNIRRFSGALGPAPGGPAKPAAQTGSGLYAWYCRRYLTSSTRRAGPLVHMALLAGGLGYGFEYSHLREHAQA